MNDRATLLAEMRENFREKAMKNAALYSELCAEEIPGDAEKAMNILWLKSVTDGTEASKLYYHSPLWKRISQDILLRDGHICVACHRDAELVHHRRYSYEVMVGLDDSKLISLCKPCHHHIHLHEGRKTLHGEWEKRLRALQKSFAKKRKQLG